MMPVDTKRAASALTILFMVFLAGCAVGTDFKEPIVETPMNAVDTFLSTGIDVLVLHDLVIRKSWAYRLFFPFHKLIQKIHRNMSTEAWMMWYEKNVLTK